MIARKKYLTKHENLYGRDALIVLEEATRNKRIIHLMKSVLSRTYYYSFGAKGAEFISYVFTLLESTNPASNSQNFIQRFVECRRYFESLSIGRVYRKDFRTANLRKSIEVLGKENFKGIVVDVGCDDNRLGEILLDPSTECIKVEKVIGVDIEKRSIESGKPNLEFEIQENPSKLPLGDDLADTIVIRSVFHHMRLPIQEGIVDELRRVLKKTGKLLIYKDTYSIRRTPESEENCQDIYRDFLNLRTPETINLYLAAMDVFSFSIKEKAMPFPFTFRELEDWEQLFKEKGFDVEDTYYGYPLWDLHQLPLCLFYCTRKY